MKYFNKKFQEQNALLAGKPSEIKADRRCVFCPIRDSRSCRELACAGQAGGPGWPLSRAGWGGVKAPGKKDS